QVAIADPNNIAAAAPFRTDAALSNQGTGAIDPGSVLALDPAGVPLPGNVTVTYDQPTGSLILSGGINTTIPNYVPGQPMTVNGDGLSFTISGTPVNGDTFTLSANTNGVSDNRNANALGALQTAMSMDGARTDYDGAYAQIVSFVGNKTREVDVTGQAQQT